MGLINKIPSFALRRALKDSGTLTARNTTTIISGEIEPIVLQDKFEDYDDVVIVNLNSDNDCTAFINGNQQQPLPKGTSVILNHRNIRRIKIKNNGSTTISINEIEVYYRHTGTENIQKLNTIANVGNFALNIIRR